MTQDNGMDVPDKLPITKEGLLSAIETTLDLIDKGYYHLARDYLRGLYRNVRDERLVAKDDANGI